MLRQFPKDSSCYVSIDIDGLDAAVAPDAGSPEPGGLTYRSLQQMTHWNSKNNRVIGLDIVEVSPMVDHAGMTSLIAAQIAIESLEFIFQGKNTV